MYLIRLDDASEYMDVKKWNMIESLLDKYKIRPIVGIIPYNQDNGLVSRYSRDLEFWNKAQLWQSKGWAIALHGFTHVCTSDSGGINPVNNRSEFAGIPISEQKQKIRDGFSLLKAKNLKTKIFFAPSHTFDMNTLEALSSESDIRIISDTIANDIFKKGQFYFIPQQSGHVQKLPFKLSTFCYHPNNMSEIDFNQLEDFIIKNRNKFGSFDELSFKDRRLNLYDKSLRISYFSMRKVRNIIRSRK